MKISRRGGRLNLVGQSSQLVDAALTNGKPVQRFQQWLRAAASGAACDDDTRQVILGALKLVQCRFWSAVTVEQRVAIVQTRRNDAARDRRC